MDKLKEPREITLMKMEICKFLDDEYLIRRKDLNDECRDYINAKMSQQERDHENEVKRAMYHIDGATKMKLAQMKYRLLCRYGTTDGWYAALTEEGQFKAMPKKPVRERGESRWPR